MKKIVRVIIPKNPAKLIRLAQKILAKDLADGVSSYLIFLDMADMQTRTDMAAVQHILSKQLSRDAETATEDRDLVLGSHKEGIIPGKVLFYIIAVRDVLLGIYKGNEHHLGDWGFEVNENADGDISVVIPRNAPELITLAELILAKNTTDGAGSKLNAVIDMVDMQEKFTIANTKHTLAKKLEWQAEKATEARDLALGHAPKQTSYTPGTVLFHVCSVRDALLSVFRGRERNLGDWGFNVDSNVTPVTPVTDIRGTTDKSILSMLNVFVTGNSFSTGAQLIITWLLGIFNSAVPIDGILINFQYLYTVPGIYTFNITGLLTAIGGLQIAGADLTAILFPAGLHISNLDLSTNKLETDSVNGALISLDANGILNGTVNLSGGTNAAPTGQGIAAKNHLIAKGWTVITN